MSAPVTVDVHELATPIGPLTLVTRDAALHYVAFPERWGHATRWLTRRHHAVIYAREATLDRRIAAAFAAYFAGDLTAVDTIAVDTGGTDFQRRVWDALRTIRPGQTASYGDLARVLGDPGAVRAVGAANGANPVSIVIPCHRVIGTNGKLHGYGGGLARKQWLLEHEGALSPLFAAAQPAG